MERSSGLMTYVVVAVFVSLLLGGGILWVRSGASVIEATALRQMPAVPSARVAVTRDGRSQSALGLAWGGWAEGAFDSSALAENHTLAVRFMPQFEAAFRGVIVSDAKGLCRVGMAPYSALNAAAIEVTAGGVTFTSPLPDPRIDDNDFRFGPKPRSTPRWRHLAITSRDGTVSVYLDGVKAGTLAADTKTCGGRFYFGRLPKRQAVQDQFYGFIDDVALFDAAFSEPEIRALSRLRHLEPALAHLVAGWTFDRGSEPPSGVLRSVVLRGSAVLTQVSRDRDPVADARLLPKPTHRTRLSLPFERGEAWLVIQGINSGLSHHDIAAFAMDFLRVDPAFVRHNPQRAPGGSHAGTLGRPVRGAASGTLSARVDCFSDDGSGGCLLATGVQVAPMLQPSSPSNRNLACVTHLPEETSCYVHLQRQSARALRAGERVASGARLGSVGKSGAAQVHLHFALSDAPEPSLPGRFSDLVTIPFQFSDYFVSEDFGRSWLPVEAGTPLAGQWVALGEVPGTR